MQKALKIVSFLFFLVSFLILLRVLLLNYYPDFTVHYYSPKIILAGQNPYLERGASFIPDVYPPFAILFFSPFALLSFPIAEKTWAVISILSLLSAVYLIFKIYNKNIFSVLGFVVLGLVSLSFPVKFTLGMGQINNLILFLFVLSIYFLDKKKNYLSSFFLVLSLAIKFFPVFFPLYFLIKKKWKILFFAAITFCLFYVIAFLLDPKINIYFYKNILSTFLAGWKTDYYNQSLSGFIGRIIADGNIRNILRYVFSIIFVVISFLAIFKTLKSGRLQNMHLSLLVTLNLLVSNFSWQHHFALMVFPFLVTLFYVQRMKNNLKFLFVLFISYVLISFNIKNPNDVPILLQSHVFYGAVLLWILEVFLIWKDSRKPGLRFPSA